MNPKTNFETTVNRIQKILEQSTKISFLRDEILVQILKQLTDNPNM
jgi:hypothetical protein